MCIIQLSNQYSYDLTPGYFKGLFRFLMELYICLWQIAISPVGSQRKHKEISRVPGLLISILIASGTSSESSLQKMKGLPPNASLLQSIVLTHSTAAEGIL